MENIKEFKKYILQLKKEQGMITSKGYVLGYGIFKAHVNDLDIIFLDNHYEGFVKINNEYMWIPYDTYEINGESYYFVIVEGIQILPENQVNDEAKRLLSKLDELRSLEKSYEKITKLAQEELENINEEQRQKAHDMFEKLTNKIEEIQPEMNEEQIRKRLDRISSSILENWNSKKNF